MCVNFCTCLFRFYRRYSMCAVCFRKQNAICHEKRKNMRKQKIARIQIEKKRKNLQQCVL